MPEAGVCVWGGVCVSGGGGGGGVGYKCLKQVCGECNFVYVHIYV